MEEVAGGGDTRDNRLKPRQQNHFSVCVQLTLGGLQMEASLFEPQSSDDEEPVEGALVGHQPQSSGELKSWLGCIAPLIRAQTSTDHTVFCSPNTLSFCSVCESSRVTQPVFAARACCAHRDHDSPFPSFCRPHTKHLHAATVTGEAEGAQRATSVIK